MSSAKFNTTKQTIGLFWDHAKRYPWYLWPLVLVIPANVIIGDFWRPFITADILNHLGAGAYDHQNLWASFGPQLLLYAAASVATGLIGWRLALWLLWQLEIRVMRDIDQRVFKHLLTMSATFHANRFGGSLVSQSNKLSSSYVRFIDSTIFNLIPLIISIVAITIVLAPRAPLFVAILIAISIAYLVGTVYFSRDVREANRVQSALQSRQTGYLADSITNIMAIKTFSSAQAEQERYWEAGGEVQAAARRAMAVTLKRQNYAAIMTQSLSIAAIVVAVVGAGALKADVGTVFLIVSYTATLAERLWNFQNVLRNYNRALADATDMTKILQIKPGVKDPVQPEPSRIAAGAISFRHMSFTHGENDEALFEDFNLDIKPGEKIGLVGHSGSGKTTLTRLLLRFSDIDSGKILIDGQDIKTITQDDVRRAIGYVPQEPMLFHRTLRENIAYGQPNATDEQIEAAAKRSHAAEFIAKLPLGYETMVGERGVKLSGGQRQRIAIARAMLKAAPILVLDEATSALDSESEHLIQEALWSLMEGRTAIVIAHRLSTIQRMDRIVVLEDGAITEQGSHAKLSRAKGPYARLWSHQSGGFIDE